MKHQYFIYIVITLAPVKNHDEYGWINDMNPLWVWYKQFKAKQYKTNPYAYFIRATMKSRVHYDVCHAPVITADHGMASSGTCH